MGLSILHGEIKSLEVRIPWTALLSSPVKVLIDGISLQVGPIDAAEMDKEEIRAQILSSKIELADQLIDFSGVISDSKDGHKDGKSEPATPATPAGKATYVQQWSAKIIDNIEITLKNVHVRSCHPIQSKITQLS